jgi:hypothetical protein
MSNYLPKDDPKVLLAQYRNQSDTVSDTLQDFIDFVDNTDGVYVEIFPDREAEDKFYVILNKLRDKFLLEDEESQTRIKREELNLLKKWKGK